MAYLPYSVVHLPVVECAQLGLLVMCAANFQCFSAVTLGDLDDEVGARESGGVQVHPHTRDCNITHSVAVNKRSRPVMSRKI